MSENKDHLQEIIEALQAARYFRTAYASGDEGRERIGQVLRLLKNKKGAEHDVRGKVADAIAESWGLDLTPKTDPTGRLVV